MHAATKLVCKAMTPDLGDAIANQVRDYAEGASFFQQNPNAMRKALEWLHRHERMLEQALDVDGREAVESLASDIEQELEEARR